MAGPRLACACGTTGASSSQPASQPEADADAGRPQDKRLVRDLDADVVRLLEKGVAKLTRSKRKFADLPAMRRHLTKLTKLTRSHWAPVRKHIWRKWSVARFWQLEAAKTSGKPGGRFARECAAEFAAMA